MSTKYAIVTGAASGVGKSVTQRLMNDGYYVFAVDIQPMDYLKVDKACSIICDISCEDNVKEAFQQINAKTKHIDCLINSAGILCKGHRYTIEDMDMSEWTSVMATNLTGCLLVMKYSIPLLRKATNASILNFSSEQTERPITKSAPYLVSKSGIESLTKLAALELLNDKIRVNCLRTAAIDTPFLKTLVKEPEIREKMRDEMDKKMPFGIIQPESIGELALWLISEKCHHISGQIITVDSGVLL